MCFQCGFYLIKKVFQFPPDSRTPINYSRVFQKNMIFSYSPYNIWYIWKIPNGKILKQKKKPKRPIGVGKIEGTI